MTRLAATVVSILVVPLLCILLNRPASDEYYGQQERHAFQVYSDKLKDVASPEKLKLGIMSFNVREDVPESDPDNNFVVRLARIRKTIQKWDPALVGLQEPFGNQVALLLLELHPLLPSIIAGTPPVQEYDLVGYDSIGSHRPRDLVHPTRKHDFDVSILYRKDRLELVDSGVYWLGEGDVPTSMEPRGGFPRRKAVVGLFRVLGGTNTSTTMLLHVNTHLTVRSELGRREQTQSLLKDVVLPWKRKYPTAHLFVTGDFNSVPGQAPQRLLTGNDNPPLELADAWLSCAATTTRSCYQTGPSNSFHGYWGSATHTPLFQRLLLPVLHTFHAMQLNVPLSPPPMGIKPVLRVVRDLFTVPPEFSMWESIPSGVWTGRYHVDWILHEDTLSPLVLLFGDVRSKKFSSDHYPLIGLFELSGGREAAAA